MRVPVLVVLTAQEPLRESAFESAGTGSARAGAPLEAVRLPAGLELDTTYPAVPVGSGEPDVRLESLGSELSEQFVVRGFVEVAAGEAVPEFIGGQPVYCAETRIQPFLTCLGDPPVGDVARLRSKLGIEALAARGLDGEQVAIAIVDGGLNLMHLADRLGAAPRLDVTNSWTVPGIATAPGEHAVDHGTMCAFDALLAAPRATLLDYRIFGANPAGGSAASGTIGTALQAFSNLLSSWAVVFAADGTSRYRALVVNNSWGVYHPSWDFPPGHRGRYVDNPRHPFNVLVAALAASGADLLFAAGNCGAQCPDGRCEGLTTGTITGANAHPAVLTIAGCDLDDARVGYSSQGPSIPGLDPRKPDLASYTHFRGSEVYGNDSADSGTSAACPVAAGCVAALRTRLPFDTHPPAQLFARLREFAMPAAGQARGWNGDCGHGLLAPLPVADAYGLGEPASAPSDVAVAGMALYTVNAAPGGAAPDLAGAAVQLGAALEDLDASYGVVVIDPVAGLYAVQARADRVRAQPATDRGPTTEVFQGPYSEPRIEPSAPVPASRAADAEE
jgi:hypothetical protein